jgi:hypothetical protein
LPALVAGCGQEPTEEGDNVRRNSCSVLADVQVTEQGSDGYRCEEHSTPEVGGYEDGTATYSMNADTNEWSNEQPREAAHSREYAELGGGGAEGSNGHEGQEV